MSEVYKDRPAGMDRARGAVRDSTLIIYLSPSVRVSYIDPLGRVKCNAVCSIAAAHKGRCSGAHLHARRAPVGRGKGGKHRSTDPD